MIPLLGISQNGFPKVILIDNDTIVGFSKEQAYTLEGYRLDLKYSQELNKALLKKVDDCELISNKRAETILKYDDLIKDYKELDKINSDIILSKDKTIKRQANAMKIGGVAVLVGVTTLLLLLK